MLRLFKSNHPIILIFIPILSGFISFHKLPKTADFTSRQANLGISELVLQIITNSGIPVLLPLSVFILLILISWIIIRLDMALNFTEQKNYMNPLFFLILTRFSNSPEALFSVLTGLLFILWIFFQILKTNRKDFAGDEYFKSGFLTAMAAIFYPKFAWYLVFVLISLLIFRPMIWREWVAVFLGFINPYIILFLIFFMSIGRLPIENYFDIPNFSATIFPKNNMLFSNFLAFYFIILIAVSASFLFRKYPNLNILKRKFFHLFTIFFILSWIIYFISTKPIIESLIPAAISVSFIISYYFTGTKKKIIPEIIFDLFLIIFLASLIFPQIEYSWIM